MESLLGMAVLPQLQIGSSNLANASVSAKATTSAAPVGDGGDADHRQHTGKDWAAL